MPFKHWKFFDDATAAAKVDLRNDLMSDLMQREKPLKYEEFCQLVLKVKVIDSKTA